MCLSHPKVDEATQNALPEQLREIQTKTYEHVKDYLRNKATDDPEFLARFLEFVTGTCFLTLDGSTKIIVAFEQVFKGSTDEEKLGTNKALPKVWTCVKWISMPKKAYDGNYEDMASAMDMAMDSVGSLFTTH